MLLIFYNNIINLSYNNIKEFITYIRNKFYIVDKIEELVSENSENNVTTSNNIENKNTNNSNINTYYYLALSMIVVSTGVLIYLYFNNDDSGMDNLLQGLSHLKPLNYISDNESLIDLEINDYFVEPPKDIFNNIPISRTDSDSTVRN